MQKYIENIVIGHPIVSPKDIFALNEEDWEKNEKEKTIFTEERFLPNILVDIGIVKSKNEIRRNKPQFMISLDKLDYMEIKWGKKHLFLLVGCQTKEEQENILKDM